MQGEDIDYLMISVQPVPKCQFRSSQFVPCGGGMVPDTLDTSHVLSSPLAS